MPSTGSHAAADDINPLGLHFTNRFTTDLPADPSAQNTRRQVSGACFSRVEPTPTAAPRLLAYSSEVAQQLGLSPDIIETNAFASVMNGNLVSADMDPYAMCYGGHQFGNWAGQLGDGRAIALGEVLAADGTHQTLQLKGSGPTPYSRQGDGRAVLRSSVREFLCSEAMFHLGVPTTRALSLTASGDMVMRDMFYDGNAALETGAVVCRVAPSFLRFGSFELFPSRGDLENLSLLVARTIRVHFSHLLPTDDGAHADVTAPVETNVIAAWFAEVVNRTAHLMVEWMRVGFVHGVMNTDNLSILGLTIDYGPYGWLEGFDPNWTPNTTDAGGRRYRYGNQPAIGQWNLMQLANAVAPLFDGDVEPLQQALDAYPTTFGDGWNDMMVERLGLVAFAGASDNELFGELGRVLQLAETDMTIFHRQLCNVDVATVQSATDEDVVAPIADAWYDDPSPTTVAEMATWIRKWANRAAADSRPDDERIAAMKATNPKYVLRNWMAQLVIDQADAGDPSGIETMLEVLRDPYGEQPEHHDTWFVKRPEWARERAGCSMLSCSS